MKIKCPECDGKKGTPPDEPCERCEATGEVEARSIDAIAADLRLAMASRDGAKLKADRLMSEVDEARDDAEASGVLIDQLNTELLTTIAAGDAVLA